MLRGQSSAGCWTDQPRRVDATRELREGASCVGAVKSMNQRIGVAGTGLPGLTRRRAGLRSGKSAHRVLDAFLPRAPFLEIAHQFAQGLSRTWFRYPLVMSISPFRLASLGPGPLKESESMWLTAEQRRHCFRRRTALSRGLAPNSPCSSHFDLCEAVSSL